MRYEIDDNDGFAIRIFNDGETVPFQFQPDYPDTSPFTSHAEAEAWAQAAIAAHDPAVTTYAPNGPGIPGELKFSAVETQKAADRAAGIAALKAVAPTLTDAMINAMLAP